jgi:hypothetical protein
VLTYRQPVGTLLQSLGTKVAPHDMSHYSPGDRMAASQKRDATQSELLAGLIDKLKAWAVGEEYQVPDRAQNPAAFGSVGAPRIISYCCLHRTGFVREAADLAGARLPVPSPIGWDDALWTILMGIEHERIHLETSSVLIRQLRQPVQATGGLCRHSRRR